MKTALQKRIMRRVYYSYTLRFLSEPLLWQGAVLGACIALFGRMTHVASIYRNLSATKIENAPSFVYNSFVHALNGGEVMTVLVTLFIVILSASLMVRALPFLLGINRLRTA